MSKAREAGIDGDQYVQEQSPEGWLWDRPRGEPRTTLILAHGAGAPMDSEFMQHMAQNLVACGVALLRFEFAYMAARRQDGKKRPPNPQAQLLEQWREVYHQVRQQVAGPLAIGGKSMGGRMASLLADELSVDALVCLGYPFYAVGKPEKPRVAHLAELKTPTLIIQGERDALGNRQTVEGYALSGAIKLHWLTAGDHDLKPLKSSGFTHSQHLLSAAEAIAAFIGREQDAA
ncbi:dienelactone hydrolase family protein [Pseudomonas sp. MIL19]|uniref:alpha/beta family hydrolase n=1 Tax=Pseudomonas sp. MIL19 TaxID=2976979 RepID=UPI002363B95E|nr:alpha/beta family hydrolase [Pseudomonas sp. MIL19]MBU0901101.1 dienelactone hydrolase family protein [Gammaproteobacteria bacterium]MDD2161663.1 dienelactone hydrolase family protein [Pseudomonas sp. MIL19]